uniref:Tartrate-resistant acid phosphatase type 5 n=1 Tax=Panagrolaimus sp. JU765 TaxID=591449 RepID=A0AC34RD90_9BILA
MLKLCVVLAFSIILFCVDAVDLEKRLECAKSSGCKFDTNRLAFFLIGDAGGCPFRQTTEPQLKVAESMSELHKSDPVDFIINLGDNFYADGVADVKDPRFQTMFENPYMKLDVPWYVIAGNHDYLGNVKAQIDYTKLSGKWTFPNYNYTLVIKFGNPEIKVVFIMTDSVRFCDPFMKLDVFTKLVQALQEKANVPESYKQAESEVSSWILSELEKHRDADYLFVTGHYPIYSGGYTKPSSCMINSIEDKLYEYNVTAYLSGHDHNLQHIMGSKNDKALHHVISGAGSRGDMSYDNEFRIDHNVVKFKFPVHGVHMDLFGLVNEGGFIKAEIDSEFVNFSFFDQSSVKHYDFKIPKRTKNDL